MIRQRYYPTSNTARPGWLLNFANGLPEANVQLGLPAAQVEAIARDARYLAFLYGAWLAAIRRFGRAATVSVREAATGRAAPEGAPFEPPVFTPPNPPAGVVPVPAGAELRVFKFVQSIKACLAYDDAIGHRLGIIGPEKTASHPAPVFRLALERGPDHEWVRIVFRKYGHKGVTIYSRRGIVVDGAADDQAPWEELGIDTRSPAWDRRPLLVAGQPEIREYRLRYFEDDAPTGEYSPVESVTVGP